MRKAIYRWLERNRWAGDALIATGFLVVLLIESRAALTSRTILAMCLITAAPLFFRRNFPELMLVGAVGAMAVNLYVNSYPTFGVLLVPVAVHGAVAYADHRVWGRLALLAGLAGSILGPTRWGYHPTETVWQVWVALCAAVTIAAFVAGERFRDRHEYMQEQLAALTERTRLLTVERDQRVRIAAASERSAIARELHDIVAHSLSVIVVQADGGAAAATKNPEIAATVLRTISETSRDALREMRRLVGVLRSENESAGPDLTPQPGLTELPQLIDQVRLADIEVELIDGIVDQRYPPTIELTVYRIIQEALTNVIQHAGPQAKATIDIRQEGGVLKLTISDDGRGNAIDDPTAESGGNGLLGMRERLLAQGGQLTAGPRVGGGFEVRASIPVDDRATSTVAQ